MSRGPCEVESILAPENTSGLGGPNERPVRSAQFKERRALDEGAFRLMMHWKAQLSASPGKLEFSNVLMLFDK